MASTEFDPYLKWLGIRDPERPPNHYRLLGVEPLESDLDVIETAADRQMAHVRTYQSGKYGALSQRILNELSQARGVLLDPEKKAEYDRKLRKKIAEAEAAAPPEVAQAIPIAAPLPVARALPETDSLEEESPIAEISAAAPLRSLNVDKRTRTRRTSPALLIGGVAVAVLGIPLSLVLAFALLDEGPGVAQNSNSGGGNGANSAPPPRTNPNGAGGNTTPAANTGRQPNGGEPSGGNGSTGGNSLPNPPNSGGHAEAPITTNTAAQRLTEARVWLLKRNFAEAEKLLVPLMAAQLTADLRNEIEATRRLGEWAAAAFQRAEQIAAGLEPGRMLTFDDRMLKFLEQRENIGLFEEEGENLELPLTAAEMPGWLAAGLLASAEETAGGEPGSTPPVVQQAIVVGLDPAADLTRKAALLQGAAASGFAEAAQLRLGLGYNFQMLARTRGMGPPQVASETPGAGEETGGKLPPARGAVSEQVAEPLRAARAALAARNLQGSRAAIGTASFRATTQSEQVEIRRLQEVEQLLVEFWTAVDNRLENLQVGAELGRNAGSATVTAVQPERFQVRIGEEELWFNRSRESLTGAVSMGLARGALEDTPRRTLIEAAFNAIDRDGDRERAARYLARAAEGGLDITAVDLELKYDYTQLVALGPQPDPPGGSTEPVPPAGGDPLAGGPAGVKRVVPEDAAARAATAEIRKLFAAEYAAAKDSAQRTELARMLLETGRKTDDETNRYVLYQEAVLAATSAGDPVTADQIAQALARDYGLEPLAKRLEVLNAAQAKVVSPEATNAVLQLVEEIAAAALAVDQFAPAEEAYDLAIGFGTRKRLAAEIRRHLAGRKREIGELRSQFETVATARETLKEQPNDPAANHAVGRYLVAAKGDWRRALPHLAKSTVGGWALAAKADLESPTDPTLMVAVADAWAKVADASGSDVLLDRVKERALYWYELVVERLEGLERRRVEVAMAKLRPAEGSGTTAPVVNVGARLQELLRSSRWNIEWSDDRSYVDATFLPDGTFTARYQSRRGAFPLPPGRWVLADNEVHAEIGEFRRQVRIRIAYDPNSGSVQMVRYDRDSGEQLSTLRSITPAQ